MGATFGKKLKDMDEKWGEYCQSTRDQKIQIDGAPPGYVLMFF